MGCELGIVGLPNVGKSTLFNALTSSMSAASENFPFCTIEPNVGTVTVPDYRLKKLADISGSKNIIPSRVKFVDIAGLVKGASKGEGLGNQFLGNIREVDAIVHLVRCFSNDDVIHVEGKVDPISDIETIETELMLSDIARSDKLLESLKKSNKKSSSQDEDTLVKIDLLERVSKLLEDGVRASVLEVKDDEKFSWRSLQLLTAKPLMMVCNVDEKDSGAGNQFSAMVEEYAKSRSLPVVVISAAIECEIANIDDKEEREMFLSDLGVSSSGLDRMVSESYSLLELLTYFTTGPKETHAWTVPRGYKAPQAAGVIHSDFEKGFIRAETASYEDFVSIGGEAKCREQGKLRLEGKDYIVQDGDVMHFRFAV